MKQRMSASQPRARAAARRAAGTGMVVGRAVAVGVLAAALVLGLAGCGAESGANPAGTPVPATATGGPAPEPGVTDDATASQIAAARLEPCPESDQTVPPVSGGLPDLTLPCLGLGPAVRLAGLRGLPMVVNVWSSTCAPCITELPAMGQVARLTVGRVRFLGIDYQDSRAAGLAMAASTNMGFASVQDAAGDVRSGVQPFVGLPTTLFVRPDGTIAGRVAGPVADAADLQQKIEQYLGVRAQ